MLVLLFNTVPLPIQKLAISFHNLVNAVSKIFLVFHETICAEFIRETFGSHLAEKLRVIWRCRLPSNTQIRSWRQNRSIKPLTLIYLYLLLVRISDGPKNKRQPQFLHILLTHSCQTEMVWHFLATQSILHLLYFTEAIPLWHYKYIYIYIYVCVCVCHTQQ